MPFRTDLKAGGRAPGIEGELHLDVAFLPGKLRHPPVDLQRSARFHALRDQPHLCSPLLEHFIAELAQTGFVAESLPAYMVPARIYELDSIPMSSNGKIDRNELARMLYENHVEGQVAIAPPN